jgi:hypothetical protein
MVAPIDARSTLVVDDETIELAMNYRTIALAEDTQVDVVTSFGAGKPKLSGMATLVWAFAQPAHPELTLDQALGLVVRSGAAVGVALGECFKLATKGAEAPGDAGSRPPRKAPTSR